MMVLTAKTRSEFREWLDEHAKTATECFVYVKRGKPTSGPILSYLDAVEEALCFGWIDSRQIKDEHGILQRFSPRRKSSPWSELNKERCRRLIRLGLMTPLGEKTLPPLGPRSFHIDPDVEAALKKARCYQTFCAFPPLYQRVRAYNVAFYKNFDPALYQRALSHLISETKQGRMFGEWNDYGRLLELPFYGQGICGHLRPQVQEYEKLGSPVDLYSLLLTCWGQDTCAPRMAEAWPKSHPTLGQCSITAFLVQDLYGGEVYGVPLGDGNFHCFNVVDDVRFDLTSGQFGEKLLHYTLKYPQSREIHFQKKEKEARYLLLRQKLLQVLETRG